MTFSSMLSNISLRRTESGLTPWTRTSGRSQLACEATGSAETLPMRPSTGNLLHTSRGGRVLSQAEVRPPGLEMSTQLCLARQHPAHQEHVGSDTWNILKGAPRLFLKMKREKRSQNASSAARKAGLFPGHSDEPSSA